VRTPTKKLSRPGSRFDGLAGFVFVLPAFLFVAFVFFYAIFAVAWSSFHDQLTDSFIGFDNYRSLFSDPIFREALLNNAKLLVVLPVLVLSSLIIAQLLFDRVRGWRIYRALIFLPYIVPVVVAAIVFGQILQTHGFINSILEWLHLGSLARNWLGDPDTAIWTVAGVLGWRELSFGVILFLARMTQLPTDLYDAAMVDGANWWQSFRYVTIPQMAVIIAFYCGIVVVALLSWVFNYVLVLTRGGPGTSTYVLEYYIYSRGFTYGQFGTSTALSSLLLVSIVSMMFAYLSWLNRRGVL